MKKFLSVMLIAVLVFSLTACTMGTNGADLNSTEAVDATEAPKADITKYKKDFDGMQKYLQAMELIPEKGTKTQAEIIGAEQGIRYTLDSTDFVEFYEINTKSTPDEAQKVFDSISKDGTFMVLDFETLKGEYSSSGKFLIAYKEDSTYDYTDIIEEFKKF